MPGDQSDWREVAKELYREAQTELNQRWHGIREPEIESLKEDLREALLDLKQAVLDGRESDGRTYLQEVTVLLFELNLRDQGDSDA